ncbi:MAG: transketolase [Microgenomates group bacterium]
MPLFDSKKNKILKKYSSSQLKEIVNQMRGVCLTAITLAGSGHPGGSLSIMDVCACLYLNIANLDPKNPRWQNRDRIIFSAGHKAPALYTGLAFAGFFPVNQLALLRRFASPFQGHPHHLKLPGVEASTGSLGQGLSIGVGVALSAKLDKKKFYTYVITGDGEWNEGQMWEAALQANHYQLDNLIVVIDRNYLQIDGCTEKVLKLDPMDEKLKAFGWEVFVIDGHNIDEILKTFNQAKKTKGKPIAIIAKTIKGKGVSFMENVAGWHGKAPNEDQLIQALKELKVEDKINLKEFKKTASQYQQKIDKKIKAQTPVFKHQYYWNSQPIMKVSMEPTRLGFGRALEKAGGNKKVVVLGNDISESVKVTEFYANHPERKNRFFSMGIAEQSTTSVAAGLAKEGKSPLMSTYGVFISQRNADQMRTTVCYGEFNVLFGGAHGGISVGPDGPTHQSLEEISVVSVLPNMKMVVPADSLETEKATLYLLLKINSPKYIRFAREATPIITRPDTPFIFGIANIYRFRKEKEDFLSAFDIYPANNYRNENEDLTIIACGPQVAEALKAAWILKKEFHLETRVVNMHTIKPLDKQTIIRCAQETPAIITAEEHQKGGLGDKVAAVILEANLDKPIKFLRIGIEDRFGETGQPWELIYAFGLSGEHIAEKARKLLSLKRSVLY